MQAVKRIGLLVATLTLAAFTVPIGSVHADSHPCAGDIAKFCSDVQPGGHRIRQCLKVHAGDLSPGCKNHFPLNMAKMTERHRVCANDAATFCKDVKPGDGRVRQCLKQHQAQLSAECAATF
ncbi:MAG TPA: cysteine rich repeat-containing protein [Candidatus Binatia bacterium]|nr:cysteine rich repeat-containing protein [Candidatus Binatia bacterium]